MQIAGLDAMDNRIVNLLLENGRASYSEIGETVGLSRTAAKNRIRALEAAGIIRGYQAILDPQAATGGMTFVVNIETEVAQFAAIKDAMAAAPETLTLMQTTGQLPPGGAVLRAERGRYAAVCPGAVSARARNPEHQRKLRARSHQGVHRPRNFKF